MVKYLDCVIKKLCDCIHLLDSLNKDDGKGTCKLGKYVIPEGVEIFLFPNFMQRNKNYCGEHALKFDPER